MSSERTAIILNSGFGHRMGDMTRDRHKAMVALQNGESIFGRQLRLLADCGVRKFVVTTGPYEEQLRAVAGQERFRGLDISFVPNPEYRSTNYIVSLYLARKHIPGDALLLHGDLVFDRAFVKALLSDNAPCLGAVDSTKPQPEKDFKARVRNGRILEIGVNIMDANCFSFQPFYKLDGETLSCWFAEMGALIKQGETKVYAENALNRLLDTLDLRPFDASDYFVEEIDTPEDYARVSEAVRRFDYREQETAFGLDKLPALLRSFGATRPMLVAGFPCASAQDALTAAGFFVTVFSDFSPNPPAIDAARGAKAFRDQGCDSLVSVGGGSAMDVGKLIKLFAVLDKSKPYLTQPLRFSGIPHIAVPTTAGTGAEATRFAVCYENGEKISVEHDCALPDGVVLDENLLASLPALPRRAALLDALCHGVESLWARGADAESAVYAQRGLDLMIACADAYLAGDASAAREALIGANDCGRAINLSKTTAAHAMSYQLTEEYGLPHGYAAALCLLPVWGVLEKHMGEADDPARLRAALDKAERARETIRRLLNDMPAKAPFERMHADARALSGTVNAQRLGNFPVRLDRETLEGLYGAIE